jgi:glycosyltransferase involved in cell wall biosynthesis
VTRDALRLLVIDPTPIGSLCATGQFKGMLFRDWPADDIVELTTDFNGNDETVLRWGLDKIERFTSESAIVERIREFAPETIYVRPEPSRIQHFDLLLLALQDLPYPAALHIMDDWVAGDFVPTQAGNDALISISRYFAKRAALRYTDGPAYIADFAKRLRADFVNLLNAIDLERWRAPMPARPADQPFILTHMGNWDREMSRQAILDIAEAAERLQIEFEIRLHVHVRDYAVEAARKDLAPWSRAHVFEQKGDFESYVRTLRQSDVNLYAYNQDPISVRYMGKGIPNKTCELLAAGKPILAYGPATFGGLNYLRENNAACIVVNREDLHDAIKGLHRAAASGVTANEQVEHLLRRNHDATRVRAGFMQAMRDLSATKPSDAPGMLEDLAAEAARHWHGLLRDQIISHRRNRSRAPRIYAVETEAKALGWRLQDLSAKLTALDSAAQTVGDRLARAYG